MTIIRTYPNNHIKNIERDQGANEARMYRAANRLINKIVPIPNWRSLAESHVLRWQAGAIDLATLNNCIRHQVFPGYHTHMARGVEDFTYNLVKSRVNDAVSNIINGIISERNRKLEEALDMIQQCAIAALESDDPNSVYELVLQLAEKSSPK